MKPIRHKLIGALALGALAFAPNTQYAADASYISPAQSIPYSIGLEGGTTGLGGNLGWRFSNHFGVGTGFDYFSYSYNGAVKDVTYDLKLRLMSEPLNLQVYPWTRSSFRIDLGMLFNEMKFSGNATATGNKTINLPSANGGPNDQFLNANVSASYTPDVVDPYIGIGGNLYFDKAHHWSLMGALGVAYTGDGTVNLSGYASQENTKFQSDLQREDSKLRSYARDIPVWPVIKIGLTYSF
jgi:hypothetical protein